MNPLPILIWTMIFVQSAVGLWIINSTIKGFELSGAWQPWVTTAGVFVALGVAIWQKSQTDEREERARRRKSRAARAVMPATLASICSYAEACSRQIHELYPRSAPQVLAPGERETPVIPTDAIEDLKDCIEHADDSDAERIAEVIRILQIQNSRLSQTISRELIGQIQLDDALLDCIQLHTYTSSLYNYARGSYEYSMDLGMDERITSCCLSLRIFETDYPRVFEILGVRKRRWIDRWKGLERVLTASR